MTYCRNRRNKIVYVQAPAPASILTARVARDIARRPVSVSLIEHSCPNRQQRRAGSQGVGTNTSYVTPVAA